MDRRYCLMNVLSIRCCSLRTFATDPSMVKVAIVGQGVIGISTAVTVQKKLPNAQITVFSDKEFEQTCSFGPAGLFRIDNVNWEKNREYGRATFRWYDHLARKYPGTKTGVKLLSGHIQSDSKETLLTQQKANADIVYNFRWLSREEIQRQFKNPSKYCIHFSAYASEGNQYVPYLRSLLKDVHYEIKSIKSLDELGENYDIVINCAGLQAGKLAEDDDTVTPIRGIVLLVKAPWHKHFLYRDFETFTIPKNDVVAIGSVKQKGNYKSTADQEELDEIYERYCKLHPAMKGTPIDGYWLGLRPFRPAGIRIERQVRKTPTGRTYQVVHHYGHGGAGFTTGWGSALEAAKVVEEASTKCKI